jgi:hypothetical protein
MVVEKLELTLTGKESWKKASALARERLVIIISTVLNVGRESHPYSPGVPCPRSPRRKTGFDYAPESQSIGWQWGFFSFLSGKAQSKLTHAYSSVPCQGHRNMRIKIVQGNRCSVQR